MPHDDRELEEAVEALRAELEAEKAERRELLAELRASRPPNPMATLRKGYAEADKARDEKRTRSKKPRSTTPGMGGGSN
jgi:hypothetical protein